MFVAFIATVIPKQADAIAFDEVVQLRMLYPTTQNIPLILTINIRQPAIKNSLHVGEPVVTTPSLHIHATPSSAHAQAALCTVLHGTCWMYHLTFHEYLTGKHAFP